MKFFKYLIFVFLSLSSLSVLADFKKSGDSQSYSTWDELCSAKMSEYSDAVKYTKYSGSSKRCNYHIQNGDIINGFDVYEVEKSCKQNQETFLDGYIGEFAPDSVCFSGCIYASKGVWIGQGETANGNLIWGTTATSTGATCGADTPKGEDKPNTPTPMKPEECKSPTGSDGYCNKPSNKQCPSGYKQGSFNNQQICVKPSPDPDPTKPNPNDPNNGDGKGNCNGTNNCNTTNFDDSKIISAINASTSAITQAISSLSNSLSSGFSSVVNAVSSVTSAVNANTSAVNSSGDKVTSAVNENTSAVNAVKSAVNALNSSIQAVTSAVNASADKVTNAVNTNGKNTVDAVNQGTNATKENGKKLDGIKDGVDKGNGILDDIKNWLFGDVPEDPNHKIPTTQLNEKSFLLNLITVNASYCPQDKVINWSTPVGTLHKTVSFQNFCDATTWFGYLVLAASYYLGAMIVVRDS